MKHFETIREALDYCGHQAWQDRARAALTSKPICCNQRMNMTAAQSIEVSHDNGASAAIQRAHVAAILFVTCASDIFTQDVEDMTGEREEQPAPRKPGSGAAGPASNINPHQYPDEEPGAFNPNADTERFYTGALAKLQSLEEQVAKCAVYDDALLVRAVLGSKAKPSQLTREIQSARETNLIGPDHSRELGRLWQRVDRQLTKKENELKPDVVDSFADAEEDGR